MTDPSTPSESDQCLDKTAGMPFYDPEHYCREDSLAYLMHRILGLMGAEVDAALRDKDLTNAQWVPLLKLHLGSASTVAELARECDLDAGGMTRLLDRIEAKGLCRRIRSSQDRRVVNVELTDTGRALAQEIPSLLCRTHNAYLEGFTPQEWGTLKHLLARMFDNARTAAQVRKGQLA